MNEARFGAMGRDFQSFAGPGDKDLPMSEISGYQPVSRIGEVVMNAFSVLRARALTLARGAVAPINTHQLPFSYNLLGFFTQSIRTSLRRSRRH